MSIIDGKEIEKSKAQDPVFFVISQEEVNQFDKAIGVTAPGWYFYDESWAYAHGPFSCEEVARQSLDNYCKEYLGTEP